MLKFTLPEILYLFSAFHGLFLAALLVARKGSVRVNLYLSLLILLFSFYLVENVIYSSGYLRKLPHFFFTTLPLVFLIGPLFYTYIRSNVSANFKLRWHDALLLLPFLIEIGILSRFYLLPAAIKIKIYDATFHPQAGRFDNLFFVGFLVYVFATCWCFFRAFQLLSEVNTTSHQKSISKRKWLQYALVCFFSYMIASMVMTIASTLAPWLFQYTFHLNLVLQTLLIHATGYVAFLHPDLFQFYEIPKKYQSSSLDVQTMSALKIRLIAEIEQARPYLDSEVNPQYFEEKLGVSRHHLSQLLTEGMQTTFYDLMNFYRVEMAKQLLVSNSHENAKILHIAYDSGFSNKSSFLRNFRKLTGATPTEYREKQVNQVPRD